MIIISQNLVLSLLATTKPNAPRVGYRTIANINNISATYEDTFHPATDMVNPVTNLWWKSTSLLEQYVTVISDGSQRTDYIGLANHNFGSGGIAYVVQTSVDGFTWTDVTDARIPDSDAPLMHLFEEQFNAYYRLKLTPTLVEPRIAVFYIGKVLAFQRNIYVGHTPITMGRDATFVNNISENGQFLGRIVRREMLATQVKLENLSPSWYRTNFDPFAKSMQYTPFFFAWRPQSYPREVGYGWATADVMPANQRPNGMMHVSFKMQGIGDFVAAASNVVAPVTST